MSVSGSPLQRVRSHPVQQLSTGRFRDCSRESLPTSGVALCSSARVHLSAAAEKRCHDPRAGALRNTWCVAVMPGPEGLPRSVRVTALLFQICSKPLRSQSAPSTSWQVVDLAAGTPDAGRIKAGVTLDTAVLCTPMSRPHLQLEKVANS
jgi:hypothetical protein